MPWCLGTSGSVRASSIPMSAFWPLEVHTFWPFTIHSSPSRTARVWRPARSEPAEGSLNSWHHDWRPVTMSRTYRSICSWVPWVAMVGAASSSPSPSGAPAARRSRSMAWATRTASLRGTPLAVGVWWAAWGPTSRPGPGAPTRRRRSGRGPSCRRARRRARRRSPRSTRWWRYRSWFPPEAVCPRCVPRCVGRASLGGAKAHEGAITAGGTDGCRTQRAPGSTRGSMRSSTASSPRRRTR